MQRTDIRTIEVGLSEEELRETYDLAEQAARVLGYTRLQTAVDEQILDRVIRDCGIPILNEQDVAQYKAEQIKQVIENKHPLWMKYGKYRNWVIALMFLISGVSTPVLMWALSPAPSMTEGMMFINLLGTLVGLVFTMCLSLLWQRPTYRWVMDMIEDHGSDIPEFALHFAIQVKQQLPAANVYVEHLEEIPDPFIVVWFGTKQRYIACYDEPRFERNL